MICDDNVEMIFINNILKYLRNYNVLINYDLYEYLLNLGSSNSYLKYEFILDDIYVGVIFNKLYLYFS